jgi:hypothetical protein
MTSKLAALMAAAGSLAVAVPATAHPGPTDHPGHASHPAKSHKCATHEVAYVESGRVDSVTASTLAAGPDGTWSGTLVVDVTRASHAAKSEEGQTVTYTLSDAKLKVRFDGGSTGFTAGEHVTLIGKIAAVAGKCTAPSPPSSPVFRQVTVHPAS